MSQETILVTGAAGGVGSTAAKLHEAHLPAHLTAHLITRGPGLALIETESSF